MPQTINFFSSYVKTEKPSPIKHVALAFLLIFVLIVGSFIVMQVHTLILKKGISDKEDILANFEAIELQHLAETKQKIANLTTFQEQIRNTEQAIKAVDIIDFALLQKIFANVPSGIWFKDISLGRQEISLSGNASSRQAIAELEYNLRNSGICDDILVNNIQSQKFLNIFEFTMLGKLNEGAIFNES